MEQKIYNAFIDILNEELVPAMGCTEPIAVAYAGALAAKYLGVKPKMVELSVSGNIIKNVKSVIVPHTGGQKGLKTAVAAGVCFGNAENELQVLSDVDFDASKILEEFFEETEILIKKAESDLAFDIGVTVEADDNKAFVRIAGRHTNVVKIQKNDEMILDRPFSDGETFSCDIRDELTVERIVEFANTVKIEDVKQVLDRQIKYNSAISEAGLKGNYGANIGSVLLESYGSSVQNKAKACAAAGSDARMNGCELPVIINSGSGNQGITASVPVIVYAREMGIDDETLYRALVVSNLITVHLKTGIGCLSAYCGATSAGAGAGAGVCYLFGGRFDEIAHTVVNAIAINSGMICDGAKASCAAKIASAVEAGLLGWQMYKYNNQFYGGDGIVVKGVENTIKAVSRIARDGMRATDEEIINVMIESD